jgi:hypothetical protein
MPTNLEDHCYCFHSSFRYLLFSNKTLVVIDSNLKLSVSLQTSTSLVLSRWAFVTCGWYVQA